MEKTITRRAFVEFFLLGGFIGLFLKKVRIGNRDKKAMFWRKRR